MTNGIDLRSKPFYLKEEGIAWVERTLDHMTVEEKTGQLFCVLFKEGVAEEVDNIFGILSPGGCMYREMPAENAAFLTNTLPHCSTVPMLVAANLEKGGNGVVTGGTLFASPMEVAATGDVAMAEILARVCAAEGRSVGVNWAFAPIVDIDANFRNPITNTRTFGSNVGTVAAMGKVYIKTIQDMGLAASIKHFPGDGHDERDQHLVTSVNGCSVDEWDATYGAVYGACIDAGALTCMAGHIMLPSYSKALNPALEDADILPASLSSELLNGLLRGKLGFNGLIVTDATTMAGFTTAMPRKQAVPATIAAGADMFLFAKNLEEDYGFMLQGVRNGAITKERLDAAVTRILALKAALGLNSERAGVDLDTAESVIGCDQHKQWARDCADKAITLVKEQPGVLPISPDKYKRVLFYPIESSGGVSQYAVKSGVCQAVAGRLSAEGFVVETFQATQDREGTVPPTQDTIERYDLALYVINLATKSNQTSVRIEWQQPMGANCPHFINDIQTVFISVENPYHLLDVPRAKTFINTYSSHTEVLDALIDKLMGRSAFVGKSPVDPFCGKWDARL